jgi:S-adenosylmethionine hydrolase
MPDSQPSASSIITLTSDFGTQDQYVSAMKAVILGLHPRATLVDVSHDIPPQDIMAAAWILKNTAFLYPSGTVHLAVVDPGVGTQRKPIALRIKDQFFVGPDNGLFSLIADYESFEAISLDNESFWYKQRSNTFHGRDIFAPVAAHLANGVSLGELGPPISEIDTYRWAIPIDDEDGIQGWVVHIDHYGNLITNISEELYKKVALDHMIKIYVGNTIIKQLSTTFASVPDGEPAAIVGSSGMIEVIINKGDASEMLGVQKGAPVSIMVKD